MPTIDATDEERRAIRALQRLAKRWPKSLWLFATGNALHVMRRTEDGQKAHLPDDGYDPAYEVASVREIPNDGGDW